MALQIKLLEQIGFITRFKVQEHMLVVLNKSTQENSLSQTLQTKKKQIKITIRFLTGYNGIFKITNNKKKL